MNRSIATHFAALLGIFSVFFVGLTFEGETGCTPAAKAAENVGLRVATDVCREIVDSSLSSDYVALACLAVGIADGLVDAGMLASAPDAAPASQPVVRVVIPRMTWHQIQAQSAAKGQ